MGSASHRCKNEQGEKPDFPLYFILKHLLLRLPEVVKVLMLHILIYNRGASQAQHDTTAAL